MGTLENCLTEIFLSENFPFSVVKFSMYLNVFVLDEDFTRCHISVGIL